MNNKREKQNIYMMIFIKMHHMDILFLLLFFTFFWSNMLSSEQLFLVYDFIQKYFWMDNEN